jgi:hypothetical protein
MKITCFVLAYSTVRLRHRRSASRVNRVKLSADIAGAKPALAAVGSRWRTVECSNVGTQKERQSER